MVDRDLILRRLAFLETYLDQLAPYREMELAAYQQDWKTQRVVERTLHLAIEACSHPIRWAKENGAAATPD